MKRHGNLFEKIVDMDNLRQAFKRARKGKAWQRKVKDVEEHLDERLKELQTRLINGTYRTSPYKTKQIYEPKERTIYILPFFPDRIAQHAMMNVLEPLWDHLMYYHSYACRRGKGQHAGSTKTMEYVRRNKYVLKCDISKFYPSIHHDTLKAILRKKIKDRRVLGLLDEVIDSVKGERNIPIGNYLSQWMGNLYMNELDEYVKHELKVKDYIRYCDDFLLFADDKETLNRWAALVRDFVETKLRLRLSKCDLFPTARGVDFLGYRHFPQGYVLVRKTTAKRVKQRMKALPWKVKHGQLSKKQALSVLASAQGWLKHANAHNLFLSLKLEELKGEMQQ